jgi:putative spermidine/putrescine transport system ATP-binding protein
MTVAITAAPALAATGGSAGLELNGLSRSYGQVHALDGLSLTLAEGELVALLGPSGCGKTTALRIIAGFERPDAGRVVLAGHDITGRSPAKRDMGMVFQSYSLFPHLTAAENVGFGMRLRGVGTVERRKQAGELLDLVGMAGLEDRYPHQMSGGQQQRVALARALAIRPKVLLLDEPLSALDAKVRLQLREEIRRIQQELGITTLFVTHDQEEALSMADRVAVMRGGRLEQCAAPAELYDRPATAFVAEFVGTMNHLPGRMADADLVEVAGRRLPVDGERPAPGTAVKVLLRPEAITLEPDTGTLGAGTLGAGTLDTGTLGAGTAGPSDASGASDPTTAIANASDVATAAPTRGTVRVATFLGSVTRLTVTLADGSEAKTDLPSHRAAEFPAGAAVRLVPAPRPVLVVPA